MDLILRNACLPGMPGQARLVDIGIAEGRVAAIEPGLPARAPERNLGGALTCGGLIESHIHLDKACVFDRTAPEPGRLADAIRRTSAVKRGFTAGEGYAR